MSEPVIKEIPDVIVAFMSMHGPYAQTPDAMGRLYAWVGAQGLQPAGMPESVYFTDPADVPESDALWEIRAPLVAGEPMEPDAAGAGVKLVPAHRIASTIHKGPYAGIAPTYQRLAEWTAQAGLRITGAPSEVYLNSPMEVSQDDLLTEVRFPVE